MHLRSTIVARVWRASLAVALLLVWTRAADLLTPPAAAVEPPATGPAAPAPAVPDPARSAELLHRLLQVADVAERTTVARMLDPATVAPEAGGDPAKLCAWVAQNTCWVPYHGSLRGSVGVLLDRLGDGADRAILLADLLRAAGLDARLAHATLPDAVAAERLAHVHRVPAEGRPSPPAVPEGDDPTLLAAMTRFGVDAGAVRRRQAAAELSAEQLTETIVGRAAEQAPAVSALARVGGPEVDPTAAERAALADHWWVECRPRGTAAGDWVALDPTCGRPPVAATAVVTRGPDGRFDLPASAAHEVEVRLVCEWWRDGTLHRGVALRRTLRPADVIGRPILVLHQPLGWPAVLDLSREADPTAKLRDLLAQPREWVPTLMIGGETVTQAGINADGTIDPHPKLDPLAQTGGATAAAAGRAADLLSAPDDAAPVAAPPTTPTAEWLEYEVRTPGGGPPRIVRRDVFDTVGPTARAAGVAARPVLSDAQRIDQALARLGRTDVLLQPCAIPATFVQHLALRSLLDNAGPLLATVRSPPTDYAGADAVLGRLLPASVPLYGLAVARFASSRVGGSVYLDRVNVIAQHQWLAQVAAPGRGDAGPFARMSAFDVVENGVAVHPGRATDPAAVRLEQGVTDTVAEAALVAATGATPTGNASDLFAASAARGQAWVAVAAGDAARLAAMDLPADARARMADDLRAGRTVLVAAGQAGTGGLAWWSVDPATGQTLGIGPNGWGAAAGEYALLIARVALKAAVGIVCIGLALAGTGSADKKVGQMTLCMIGSALGFGGLAASGTAAGVIGLAGDALGIGTALYGAYKQ